MPQLLEEFENIEFHLLHDKTPSVFLNQQYEISALTQYPFTMLSRLKDTKQSPKHHPEGNVWNHTMLVVDCAASLKEKSKSPSALLWSALLHDIGKPDTTKYQGGKYTAYEHDTKGEHLVSKFFEPFPVSPSLVKEVATLTRWHMHILFVVHYLPFGDVATMKRSVDMDELALLGYADQMGRLGAKKHEAEDTIRKFLEIVRRL